MNKTGCWLMLLLLGGCAASDEDGQKFNGEQLQLPMPLPYGNWERFVHIYPDAIKATWGKIGTQDVLEVVQFIEQEQGDLQHYRDGHDQSLAVKCSDFSSELIATVDKNGYQEMLWQTHCPSAAAGEAPFSYHLSISGNARFYVLSRIWQQVPTQAEQNAWLDYFSEVYLCDDRLPAHPCAE